MLNLHLMGLGDGFGLQFEFLIGPRGDCNQGESEQARHEKHLTHDFHRRAVNQS